MDTPRPKGPILARSFRIDIQDKLALGVAAVFTLAAAAGLATLNRMVSQSIAQMDEQVARREASRVMDTLRPEITSKLHEVAGRVEISDEAVLAMGRRTGSYVAVFDPESTDLTQVQRRALAGLRSGQDMVLDKRPANQWIVYALVKAPPPSGAALIRATIRSPQSDEVTLAMQYAGMLLLALAAVVLIALMGLVRLTVVKPIRTLTRNVVEIGRSADLSRRVALPQDDEIGLLSREFDRMLDQLAGAQRSLMAYSFQAGARDAAVQALHDIGNAVTPVTVSLDLLRESLHEADVSRVSRTLDALRAETDPSIRDGLLENLRRDAAALRTVLASIEEQLAAAIRHSSSIEAILRRNDPGERPSAGSAAVTPHGLAATAVAMLCPADRSGISIELDPSLDPMPELAGAQPGLFAVFHAILTNAVEAVRAAGIQGQIRISGETTAPGTVTIRIADNGIGIPPEHLTAVFGREFTTKNRPKTMFSLHWCASVVAASRGSLRVESAGHGKGTSVIIKLPCA